MSHLHDDNQDRIVEEAIQRFMDEKLQGRAPDVEEFVAQYPGLEQPIRERLQNLKQIGALFQRLTRAAPGDFDWTQAGLSIGERLGTFEVVEMIGRGGMGVVYKARDTRLDREVAVKTLPAELLGDATAQSRFRREAKTLASLNHPNIAAIHDIVETDDGLCYLILEYVPGQTLGEHIFAGKLKQQEALSVAQRIAEALSAAYEKGIIHRDLKPGNIKIAPDGTVKVLDFGIAKALGKDDQTGENLITQPGRIIGTPAYMSPEQIRGQAVDHRCDVWAFGCVLYEMLVGRLAFEGETLSDTIAQVLQTEPDWEKLPTNVPTNMRILLRRCLEKDAKHRLQHIGDAAIEIAETLNAPATAPPLSDAPAGSSWSTLRRIGMVCGLAGLVLGAVATGIVFMTYMRPSSLQTQSQPTYRTTITLPEDQTLALSRSTPLGWAQPAIALSPDGSRLVYVADIGETTQLFVRLMNEFQANPIPGTEGAFCPFFSPDGRWVGFFTKDKLKKVSLLGGDPVALCDARNPRGASWGTDGAIYFAEDQGVTLTQVPAAGGATAPIFVGIARPRGRSCDRPEILPGGKWVLVSSKDGYIKLISPKTGEQKILVKDGYHACYLPTGHLVYARAGVLVAVPFDLATLQVIGDAAPILEQVLLDSTYETVQYTFSRNGLLIYAPGDDTAKSIPTWVHQDRTRETLPMSAQIYGTPKLSPDGKQLAILVGARREQDIYVYDVATGISTRLTLNGDNRAPVWTPDGKRVTFLRQGQELEEWSISWKSGDGSGDAELFYSNSSQNLSVPYCWSPNGKMLAITQQGKPGGICILALEGPREPELISDTEFGGWAPAFSPDGRWIAYTSDKEGKFQVYVRPYPDNDWVRKISDDFGEEPVWSPKGDKLFYRNGDKWMVVSISAEPEFTAGTPRVLFEGPFNNVPDLSYDVAPDGRFLVLQPKYDDSEVRELHVVTNWFEELKSLVPSPEAP